MSISVAVAGLGFGEEFLALYRDHPQVHRLGIVEPSVDRLREVGDRHGLGDRFRHIEEVLDDDRWDAVHILAPVAFHAAFSIAVLDAGKHCACAVPMATELDDLRAVAAAQRRSGKNYMMMETAVYGREYRFVERLYRAGGLGDLTFYRGYHIQNLDGFPDYWLGFPPMKYVTHALSPLLALTDSVATDVVAHGAGRLSAERIGDSGNPFPVEAGLFRLSNSDVLGNITMSFFQTARSYIEGFSCYGDLASVEWSGVEGEPVYMFETLPAGADSPLRGRRYERKEIVPPDAMSGLPEALIRYVTDYEFVPQDGSRPSTRRAHHSGSHPYLVDEFVASIVEGRTPRIDASTAAAWTAPGIVAHESSLQGGQRLPVPSF